MARPFTWKEVTELEVSGCFVIPADPRANVKKTVAGVARKVRDYGKRCKPTQKAFSVGVAPHGYGVLVTRLPDPEPQP